MKYLLYISSVLSLITALNKDLFLEPDKELQRVAILATADTYSLWKVDFLLWRGVDPLYKGDSAFSSLEWALMRGNFQLVERLAKLLNNSQKELLFRKFHRGNFNSNYQSKLRAALFKPPFEEDTSV